MPITSTLEADFSDFVAETQKANAALSDMQREATEVSTAVTTTASSMGTLGKTASTTTSGVTTLSTGLRTADKTLSAFGMNIGPQISALEEMGQMAGKTASQIGLIGTAMSVAGAALAGWNIGKAIDDMAGGAFSKGIANDVAAMLGWGNAAEQAAGAQQDLIDRARDFGYAGNSAAEAAQVLTKAIGAQQEVFNTGANKVATWTRELNDAKADGLPGLRAEIEKNVMTMEEMHRHYGPSIRAIDYLKKQMSDEAAARKDVTAKAQAQGEAYNEIQQAVTGQSAILDTLTESQRAEVEAALAASVSQSTVAKAYGLTAQQVKAVADAMKEGETRAKAFAEAQQLVDDANAAWNEDVVGRSATTTQALIADIERERTERLAALGETGEATDAHYAQIAQIASEKLATVKLNWDVLKEGTIAGYADLAARAEATYQHMTANSSTYSTQAVEHARQVRDETLATFMEMSGAHDAATKAAMARERAYVDALTEFRTEASTAQDTAFQKEAVAMDRAIAYSQTYAVTIEDAQRALGQLGETGAQAGQRTAQAMQSAGQAVGQLTALVSQSSAQMEQLAQHYQQMANENKKAGGTGAFFTPFQIGQNYEESARKMREQADRRSLYESAMGGGAAWGNRGSTNTLTVNVTNADAGNIAARLVTEMRHSGVQFG